MDKKNILIISFIYAMYFNTIGFNDGKWEKNFNVFVNSINQAIEYNYRYLVEFLKQGDVFMNLKNKKTSIDIVLLLLSISSTFTDTKFKQILLDNIDKINDVKRDSNKTLELALKYLKDNNKSLPFDKRFSNNKSLILPLPFGVIMENNKDIIKNTIGILKLTNNFTFDILAGISSALITNFSLKGIPPNKWLNHLLKLENKIDDILKKNYSYYTEYLKNKNIFWNKIKDYQDYRLKYIKTNKFFNPKYQIETFIQLFTRKKFNQNNYGEIGFEPIDGLLWAYESIILSYNEEEDTFNLRDLIINSSLHVGDNDTTGTLAGFWYGCYNSNLKKISDNKIRFQDLEFYQEINKMLINIKE